MSTAPRFSHRPEGDQWLSVSKIEAARSGLVLLVLGTLASAALLICGWTSSLQPTDLIIALVICYFALPMHELFHALGYALGGVSTANPRFSRVSPGTWPCPPIELTTLGMRLTWVDSRTSEGQSLLSYQAALVLPLALPALALLSAGAFDAPALLVFGPLLGLSGGDVVARWRLQRSEVEPDARVKTPKAGWGAELEVNSVDWRTSELIPDHALVPGQEDLFDHGDFVDRLMQVISEASIGQASANIALYGSWGAGKSGIANLVKESVAASDQQLLFAYFDAFKYARLPLLRNFVSELTASLLSKRRAAAARRRLYQARTETAPRPLPNLTPEQRVRYLKIGVPIALVLVTALGVGEALSPGATGAVADWLWSGIGKFFVIGGLLLTFLRVQRSDTRPESDEEFEQLFRDLLDDLGVDGEKPRRLVVFIDELDRCAPDEVAKTLETLRTFLGVRGCVFVVTADRHVLERALTEKVRQATPDAPANPYYSAGSAYLDKIFQYQLPLPPLRSSRISHFAEHLVRERQGVWKKLGADGRQKVIAVLLPTHVESPRRVKVLLNAFALTFAVAERRSSPSRRQVVGRVEDRAEEIAKLVCLRVEFPTFARDLDRDHRLIAAVLEGEGGETVDRLPIELKTRAVFYSRGELPPAVLLSTGHGVEQANDAEQRDRDDSRPRDASRGEVARAHGQQLLRYLRKTSDIEPRDDLIHLEAPGAHLDLDPTVSQELRRAALDNEPETIRSRLSELRSETERANAVKLMCHIAGEFDAGINARNAITALIAAAGAISRLPKGVMADATAIVAKAWDRSELRDSDLSGALKLAVSSAEDRLVAGIMAADALLESDDARRAALALSAELWPAHRRRMVELLAHGATHDGARTGEILANVRTSVASEMLLASRAAIAARVQESAGEDGEDADDE